MEQDREHDDEPGADEAAGVTYEIAPDAATSFENADAGGSFKRKKTLMILCVVFGIVIGGGLLWNVNSGKRAKRADAESAARAANTPTDFLRRELDKAPPSSGPIGEGSADSPGAAGEPLPGAVPYNGAPYSGSAREMAAPAGQNYTPAALAGDRSGGSGAGGRQPNPQESSLVPAFIEGSLFNGQGRTNPPPAAPSAYDAPGQNPAADYLRQAAALASQAMPSYGARAGGGPASEYDTQNAQDNKQAFYDSSGGGSLSGGQYLGDNALWIGTMVPGILETAINTDLPGNILARVTQHVYDSQTGKRLLIPQGSVLVARYNSSVSYAQHRVQIVWDTLIRPDGFYLDLGGMNAVDRKGMSGQEAVYHENWFEYLKAAGLITMFSFANSKMTDEVAKLASTDAAAAIAESNAEFVNQMSGNIVSRAMNIQPTLTVDSGTPINIMLNKTVYLPPLDDYPVHKRYTR